MLKQKLGIIGIIGTSLSFLLATSANAGLIGLYEFNDQNNLGIDTSGNGNNATNSGALFNSMGYEGGAASLSGGAYLQAPINPNPSVLPQMTWGAWVKPTTTNVIQTVVTGDNGSFDRGIVIDSRGGGGNTWSVFTGRGVLASGVTPSTTEWTFLAAVYNQSTTSLTFYVNNQVVSSSSTNFGISNTFFRIGRNPSFNQPLTGLVDNVFVYDQALSASEIAFIRDNGFTPVPEPVTILGSLTLLGFGTLLKCQKAR